MDSLAETTEKIRRFRDARDWMQFHSPKNLACSISIEAISDKLAINEAKYPAEKVRGSSKKYTDYPSSES